MLFCLLSVHGHVGPGARAHQLSQPVPAAAGAEALTGVSR